MGGFTPFDPAAVGATSLIASLTNDKIPKFDATDNKLVDSSITEESTRVVFNKRADFTPGKSVSLGKDGTSLSSGARAMDITDAYGETSTVISTIYDETGNETTFQWDSTASVSTSVSDVFDTALSDPQTMQFTGLVNARTRAYSIRPASSGTLRVRGFAGTTTNAPVIIDTLITIDPGDVGTLFQVILDNRILVEIDDDVLAEFSGVQLFGGLQTSGSFDGQTVPFLNADFSILTKRDLVVQGGDELDVGTFNLDAVSAAKSINLTIADDDRLIITGGSTPGDDARLVLYGRGFSQAENQGSIAFTAGNNANGTVDFNIDVGGSIIDGIKIAHNGTVGIGKDPTLGRIHVLQLQDNLDGGLTVEGSVGGTLRAYINASNEAVIQKGSNTGQITLFDNNNIELHGTPGTNIGGFASGSLRITSPATVVNANAVITGHSLFNTNTQLWYLGSVSSSNNSIAFINRQIGDMSFHTNNVERLKILSAGDLKFSAYPNTRDDGTPTNILGTDADGNLISGPNEVIHIGGNFVDTTDQVIATASTAQDITFNTNSLIDDISHTTSSATFTINTDGVYAFIIAPQLSQGFLFQDT